LRVLIDLGHPAHYHFLKNVIKHLRKQGDEILLVIRNREGIVARLLIEDGLNYISLYPPANGLIMKGIRMIINDLKLLRIAVQFKPDLFLSLSSPYSAHVSFLMRKPHISFGDTEIAKIAQVLIAPLWNTKTFLPKSFHGTFRFSNEVIVDSYKELAYLHPKYFEANPSILSEIGLKKDEKYIIVRFSSFDSSHDIGLKGLNKENRRRLVLELAKMARVFVFSENELDDTIRKFRLDINPARLHDLLCFASLYIGEGAVMASEAAVLGIPSIFINPSRRGYLDDLQEVGLVIQYFHPNDDIEEIINKAKIILSNDLLVSELKSKRDKMLSNKKDITEAIINEIEKFRNSINEK